MKWKRKLFRTFGVLLLTFFLIFVSVEWKAPSIVYSSVFSTPEQTEIHLYVQMNTLLNVNENRMAKEIISEHQMINQVEGKVVYTLHLYRTEMHYDRDCEYDTINCDGKGAIICCKGDFRV